VGGGGGGGVTLKKLTRTHYEWVKGKSMNLTDLVPDDGEGVLGSSLGHGGTLSPHVVSAQDVAPGLSVSCCGHGGVTRGYNARILE